MPYQGQINNPEGRNSFSGPMGEKEPAYGEVAQERVLTKSAPGVSAAPESAGRRAQRRAVKRESGGSGAPPGPLASPHPDVSMVEQQQAAFWTALMNAPDASPLTREYAAQALGYSS